MGGVVAGSLGQNSFRTVAEGEDGHKAQTGNPERVQLTSPFL